MARECKNCKESIVSRTPSIIGETNCNDACPQDIVCTDIIPGTCVYYAGANLDCSGILYGESVTAAIAKLNAKLCENQSNGCLFKISSNDTCCGYFQTKVLAGNGITFTIANEGACETLTISEACNTWNDILASSVSGDGRFRNGWTNVDATGTLVQKAQYSNVKACTVKLKGFVKAQRPYINNPKALIAVLPAGFRPPVVRTFSVIIKASSFYPAWITVNPSGEISIVGLPAISADVDVFVTLDGIFFETV